MIVGARIGVVASSLRSVGSLLLDPYSGGVSLVLDPFRRLLASYTGPLCRIRRSSDSTETDIAYTGLNVINSAAAVSFAGAGSAFISKIYDQSAGANHLVQAISTAQPRIVNAGVFDGKAVFDGTASAMQSIGNSGTPGAISLFIKGVLRSFASTAVMAELTTNTGSVAGENGMAYYCSSSTNQTAVLESSGTTYGQSFFATGLTGPAVHAAICDKAQSTIALKSRLWINGAEQTPPLATSTSGLPSGLFSAAKWNVGARNNGASVFAQLDLYSLVIYETSKVTDVTAISAALA